MAHSKREFCAALEHHYITALRGSGGRGGRAGRRILAESCAERTKPPTTGLQRARLDVGEKEERREAQKATNRELTNTARQSSGQTWLNIGA